MSNKPFFACCLALLACSALAQTDAPSNPHPGDAGWKSLRWGNMKGRDVQTVPGLLLPPLGIHPSRHTAGREGPDEHTESDFVNPFVWHGSTDRPKTHDDSDVGIATNGLTYDFKGIPNTTHVADPNIAVGRGFVVESVNWKIRVTDKLGNITSEHDVDDWVNDPGQNYPDGKVVYDPWRDRWCITFLHVDTDNFIAQMVVIGSLTNDPNGPWVYHRFNMATVRQGNLCWLDYEDLGYCSKAIVVAGNLFKFTNGFVEDGVYVFNPAEVYSTGSATISRNYGLTDSDGGASHTVRPARMYYQPGGGWDEVMADTEIDGGTNMTVWKMTDPLNTNGNFAIVRSIVNIADYTAPPDAPQLGGNPIPTGSSQLYPVIVGNPVTGVSTNASMWTSFTEGTANGTAGIRLLMVDPVAGVKHVDIQITDNVNSYCYPAAGVALNSIVGKNSQCIWVYEKSGPNMYPQSRYISWDKDGGLGGGVLLVDGQGPISNRMGDYFSGDMDWDDYISNQSNGWQKIWFNGEYALASGSWVTHIGCSRPEGATNGQLGASPSSDITFTYYSGDSLASIGTQDYDLTNSGNVGLVYKFLYGALIKPDIAQQEIAEQVGSNPTHLTVAVGPTMGAADLPYGVYTDHYGFMNGYSGNSADRTAILHVGDKVAPNGFTVEFGKVQSGNVNGVSARNDGSTLVVCKFLVPNQSVPPIRVRFEATLPGSAGIGTDLSGLVRARMANSGSFEQTVEMFDWSVNAYAAGSAIVDSLGTSYKDETVLPGGDLNRFLSNSRVLRIRSSIRAVGPVATFAWCAEYDQVRFNALP